MYFPIWLQIIIAFIIFVLSGSYIVWALVTNFIRPASHIIHNSFNDEGKQDNSITPCKNRIFRTKCIQQQNDGNCRKQSCFKSFLKFFVSLHLSLPQPVFPSHYKRHINQKQGEPKLIIYKPELAQFVLMIIDPLAFIEFWHR